MLAIAMNSTPLGTDPVNAFPVSCSREDTAATSFAKSFAEGSALAGEVQALSADGKMLNDAVGARSIALAKSASATAGFIGMEAQGDVTAGAIVKNEPHFGKDLIIAMKAKAVVPASGGVKGKVAGVEALPQVRNSNEGATFGIPMDVPQGLLPLDSEDVTPELTSGTVDGSKTISPGEVITPHPDIAALAIPSIPDDGGKPPTKNWKQIPIPEENQGDIQARKETKGHDVGVKKENSAKIKKTDRAIGVSGNAVGRAAQSATVIPVIVLPQDGQPTKISAAPDEGDISPFASTTKGKQRIGTAATFDSNAGKKQAGSGQLHAGDMKAQNSAVADDLASQKAGIEAAKNTTPAAVPTAGSNSKASSAEAVVIATAPKHAEGVASATGVVAVPAPVTGTQPQIGSHTAIAQAGSGMQVGAGVVDAGSPIDAAHRTLTATPTSLEVGVANGSHGWLKIRAEVGDGGVVNASLSTASSSGQEILHRELPSLTAYLQSEHVALNTVVVLPAAAVAIDPRGLASGMNGDGRGQAQQSGGQGGDNRQGAANTAMDRNDMSVSYNNVGGIRGDELLPSMSYARGGNWLSVRA